MQLLVVHFATELRKGVWSGYVYVRMSLACCRNVQVLAKCEPMLMGHIRTYIGVASCRGFQSANRRVDFKQLELQGLSNNLDGLRTWIYLVIEYDGDGRTVKVYRCCP